MTEQKQQLTEEQIKRKDEAVKRFEEKLNKLDEFSQNLIFWIKEHKPTIHVIFKNVSRSGMLRRVNAYMIKDNELYYLNHLIAWMTHFTKDSDGLIKLHGCGMDMGFHLVSSFSGNIFPEDLFRGEYALRHENL